MASTLAVVDDATLSANLSVGGAATMQSNLAVVGTGTFHSHLIVPSRAVDDTSLNQQGSVQYNEDAGWFEGYTDNEWIPFNGVRDSDNDTNILAQGVNGTDTDTLKFTASNINVADMSGTSIEFKIATNLESTLSVNGEAHFKTDVEMLGTLDVSKDTKLLQKLSVNQAAYFNGNIFTNEISAYSGSEVFIKNDLKIDGNMEITGTINSLNTTTEEILVEDLKIVLGTSSNADYSNQTFTVEQTGAGFEIDGMPADVFANTAEVDLADKQKLHEKSILWNKGNDGTKGTENIPYLKGEDVDCKNEPYWEAKGGAFRITNIKDNAGTLQSMSYSFRINKKGQLELCQLFKDDIDGNGGTCKKVATFGMII